MKFHSNSTSRQQSRTRHSDFHRDQAYAVTINTTAFQYKNGSIKQRTQRQLLPQYWNKFKMDQKIILPSKEDRLSQLTTKQIDRIIDMQRIRCQLYNKKRKLNDQYINFQPTNPNSHANVYQANFLATVNEIAIQRNIRHETSEGFDQFDQAVPNNKNKNNKRVITVPYKYTKHQSVRTRHNSINKNTAPQEQDQKSIDSISADLDAFELNLQQKKMSTGYNQKKKNQQSKLLHSRRWFYGMSTFYMQGQKIDLKNNQNEVFRADYDIQSEMKETNREQERNSRYRRTSHSIFTNKTNSKTKPQPFDKYKTNRLVTIG